MQAPHHKIDTARAPRRGLRFRTADDMWAEIDRIVAAERDGVLRRTGNWTVGQTLAHLAAWVDYAYDGYPPQLQVPWPVRLWLRVRKRRFLYAPMPAAVRIPNVPGGTTGAAPCETAEGLERLRRSWARLAAPPPRPSPLFGRLRLDEWRQLQLRHAELHLGFLHDDAPRPRAPGTELQPPDRPQPG